MTALNTFCNVTEKDIAEALTPLGFVKIDLPNTGEVVFSKKITFEGLPTICRVYTAIMKGTGESRGPGKDAIRICLGRAIDSQIRIFKTLPTIKRIGTWRYHLLDRISSIGDGMATITTSLSEIDLLEGRQEPGVKEITPGTKLKCPECGAAMCGPKPGKHGPFYGCSRFPHCRGIRNL